MKRKIMVVDNSPLMLELMSDLFSKEGHQVLTAEDGLAAMDLLQTYHPDIIFIDLIMPNIDGKKLCQIIRSMHHLNGVHLVILSATAAEDEIDLSDLGANAYIAKGQFGAVAPHLLAVVNELERENPQKPPASIMGIDRVYPREITKELLSTKKHFELILGSMSEGILEINVESRIVFANPAAVALIGVSEATLLGTKLSELFENPNRKRVELLCEKLGTSPQTISDASPLTLNGKQLSLNALSVSGNEDKAIVILKDVSEQKRAEDELQQYREHLEELVVERTAALKNTNERLQAEIDERTRAEKLLKLSLRDKEVLLREVHHRTKNNMQIISSLLNLQSLQLKSADAISVFQDSQTRIRAMALIHETFYQSEDLTTIGFKDYVMNLTQGLFGAYQLKNNNIGLSVNVDNVTLGIDSAVPCGLVINELVSNALKHAFSEEGSGTITITASSNTEHLIELIVEDDGRGMPGEIDYRNTETLGLRLVVDIVEDQLGGTIEPFDCPGTGFRITFKDMQYKGRV
jgi:PAS domain S-box-containing protein